MGIGLLAAALIQGAWWGLLRLERPRQHIGNTVTEIRLLPLPPDPRVAKPPPRDGRPTRAPVPPVTVLAPPALTPAPQRTTSLLPDAASIDAPASPTTAAPAPGQAGTASTLRLTLPPRAASSPRPESMMDQVRNDPRAHTEARTMEHRMADAMGTLPIVVQSSTSGTGSTVIQQGSKCTRVYENRIKSLHPMDDRLKDAPSVAGNC
ncbi:hypothetical protein SAMN05216359_1196 [Roseateles sp. YR242]|uniref:hypothetical protein n=1 Tax=Roseateles sp. YR242 TaxID=1855305 RepID=UPI0008D7A905|nr:hypothetical protein [Roseateles sp. YR242]SEL83768.1 hypothetical protein SAMN05216359_1196 [Roseateles sp. YR242]